MRPTWQNRCLALNEFIYELCDAFTDKYYWEDADMSIIWEDVEWMMPWPLFVNDDYFDIDEVYTAMWYNIPRKCIMQFLDYRDECLYDKAKPQYNLKSFYLLKYKTDASEDKSEKKENGYWSTITERPHQRPKWWISQWPTAIWPFVWDYPYSTDWYPTTITLCSATRECRSVKLPSTNDSDDVTAEWNDENDGWKDEKIRRTKCNKSCWRWGCKRARGGECSKWR